MQRVYFLVLLVLFAIGCTAPIKLAPVKVEPIHMTIDVNLHEDGVASNHKP
jgi:hypothetical protein